jgi:hypothetical protein
LTRRLFLLLPLHAWTGRDSDKKKQTEKKIFWVAKWLGMLLLALMLEPERKITFTIRFAFAYKENGG